MSAELPDGPPTRPVDERRPLERILTRIAWAEEPEVTLRWLPDADALVVDVLPLPSASAAAVVVHDLLAIEFDGDDPDALPTRMCLTGFTARPDSRARHRARDLLGRTLSAAVDRLVDEHPDESAATTVRLTPEVLHSRLQYWRRLRGVAVGIDVRPGEMDVIVHGPDVDDVVYRVTRIPLPDMAVDAVVRSVRDVVSETLRRRDRQLAGCPVVVGVQVPGPVDHRTGEVHHFHKRVGRGGGAWLWEDVPLATMLGSAVGLPVRVINDVVGFATYDRWVHPCPDEHVRAVLLISQGIGAKLVVDGRVVEDMPMEIGNIVLDPDGPSCECGQHGCVEATAGTLALLEQIENETGIDAEDVNEAIALTEPEGLDPNPAVLRIMERAGNDLARSVGFVQAIANPSSWAVYGPYTMLTKDVQAGHSFLSGLDTFAEAVAFKPYRECEIRRRPIAVTEGAEGAALHALEHHRIAVPSHLPSIGHGPIPIDR